MIMKTSLVCLLFVLYIGIFYFPKKRIPLKSTRLFSYFYVSAVILSVLDLITLYTVNHTDYVPETVNLGAHIAYLLAIDTTVYLYFLYLRSLLESRMRMPGWLRSLQAAPYVLSVLLVVVLPITYEEGTYTNYSLGYKVYAIYASVILYNFWALFYCLRYRRLLSGEKKVAILASVPIFIAVTVINIAVPEALFTIVYVVLTTVGLMMSNENGEKYLDLQTGMFNQYALSVVTGEYVALKREAFLAVITMGETEGEYESIEWGRTIRLMQQVQHFCRRDWKRQTYRVSDNGFVLLVDSAQTAEQAAAVVTGYAELVCKDMTIESRLLALEQYGKSGRLMAEIAEICMNAANRMAAYDYLTGVRNRNSFEKELEYLKREGVDAYYFLADLNNLKDTNDVMGHSAGDELLQATAKALKAAVGEDGTVFRYGGDEFAILWRGQNADALLHRLEEDCRRINETRIIPIQFAIGYGRIQEEDGIQKADKMMYQNKARMKGVRSRSRGK